MTPENLYGNTYRELLSIPGERKNEVVQIFNKCAIEYHFIGNDQSRRAIYEIRYTEAQTKNVLTMREGLRILELTSFVSNLIANFITDMLHPRISNKSNKS